MNGRVAKPAANSPQQSELALAATDSCPVTLQLSIFVFFMNRNKKMVDNEICYLSA